MRFPPYIPTVDLEQQGYTEDSIQQEVRDFWRYYFAGQALAGQAARPEWAGPDSSRRRAEIAFDYADALLAKLENEEAKDA